MSGLPASSTTDGSSPSTTSASRRPARVFGGCRPCFLLEDGKFCLDCSLKRLEIHPSTRARCCGRCGFFFKSESSNFCPLCQFKRS